MKEQDARQLVCCRDLTKSCIASECMAWRWDDDSWECQNAGCKAVFSTISQATYCHSTEPKVVHTGYCGLAGRDS